MARFKEIMAASLLVFLLAGIAAGCGNGSGSAGNGGGGDFSGPGLLFFTADG